MAGAAEAATGGAEAAAARRERGVDRRAMWTLTTGHLGIDLAQGAVPSIVTFLKPLLGLSYVEVAGVVLAATAGSSLVQPLFGLWSDRRARIWLLYACVALSGAMIAMTPLSHSYAVVVVLVLVSSVAVGAFHPEAMKLAGHASGDRRASGMATFQSGGNLGFALGPLIAGTALAAIGSTGGLVMLAPAALVAVLVLGQARYLRAFALPEEHAARRDGSENRLGLGLLLSVVGLRSLGFYGLFTFVPLWEVSLGHSKAYGSHLLSLVLLAGTAGTLVGGPLADRIGRKAVLAVSLALAPPLIVAYVLVGGIAGAVAVCGAGAAIVATFGISVVMSQEYLPGRTALASGLSVGLAVGLGGVFAVGLGAIADAVDLRTAILVCAVGPALGAALSLALPPRRRVAVR